MTKRLTTARMPAVVLFILLWLVLVSGCSGLSGEPRVVTTLRPAATTAPVVDVGGASLALGAQIFADRCTSCHGAGGRGDGDLVRAGQIQNVPDFTDAERRAGVTLEDYYEVITNGRIEKLMPPWKDALSEEERRAVAAYAYSLADAPQVALAGTTEQDETAAPASTPEDTPEAPTQQVKVIEGVVVNGTAGAAAPESLNVLLFVMDTAGEEVFTAIATAEDGSFRFEGVPIQIGYGYFASAVYNEVTFIGTLRLTEEQMLPEAAVDLMLVVYEVTNDPGVIEIDLLLNQAAIRSSSALDNLIVARFYNKSDRVYREAERLTDGRYGSVGLRLPAGAVPVGLNSSRYYWNQDDMRVLDTLAVIPDSEHIVHVSYTVPLNDRIRFEYVVDYPVTNLPELMLKPGEFTVDSRQFEPQGVMQFTGGQFEDYLAQPLSVSEKVQFDLLPIKAGVKSTTANAGQSVLGIGLTVAGIILLGGAGGLYLLQRRQGPNAEALIAQIAQLDVLYQAEQIDEQVYRSRREQLKMQLSGTLRRPPRPK